MSLIEQLEKRETLRKQAAERRYNVLVASLADDEEVNPDHADLVLADAGKTVEDLQREVQREQQRRRLRRKAAEKEGWVAKGKAALQEIAELNDERSKFLADNDARQKSAYQRVDRATQQQHKADLAAGELLKLGELGPTALLDPVDSTAD